MCSCPAANPYAKPGQAGGAERERQCCGSAPCTARSGITRCRTAGTLRYRCRRCVGEAVTRRHRKLKQLLVEEAGGGCAVCGYVRCLANLHFHHVDPAEKSFEIQMGSGKSLAAYREEVRKCVLVCANCHGEIEAGTDSFPASRV